MKVSGRTESTRPGSGGSTTKITIDVSLEERNLITRNTPVVVTAQTKTNKKAESNKVFRKQETIELPKPPPEFPKAPLPIDPAYIDAVVKVDSFLP